MSTYAVGRRAVNQQETWLRSERLFYLDPGENAVDGWFFKVRGPRYYGPFQSRHEADNALRRIVSDYLSTNETGGR